MRIFWKKRKRGENEEKEEIDDFIEIEGYRPHFSFSWILKILIEK